jgi:hypothetical protein
MTRRRGRPSLAPDDPDPSVTLNVRMPAAQFDATYARARDLRVTMAELVREALDAHAKTLPQKSTTRRGAR